LSVRKKKQPVINNAWAFAKKNSPSLIMLGRSQKNSPSLIMLGRSQKKQPVINNAWAFAKKIARH
jgi:hypothetical protein